MRIRLHLLFRIFQDSETGQPRSFCPILGLCVLNGCRSLVNLLPDNELALSWSINGSQLWLNESPLDIVSGTFFCVKNQKIDRGHGGPPGGGSDENNLRFTFPVQRFC